MLRIPTIGKRGLVNGLMRGGAFFSPSQLLPRVDLNPELITGLNDGDAVATLPDGSGNGYNATEATAEKRPAYKTNELNSKPIIRFSGSHALKTATIDLTGTDKTTLIVIAKVSTLLDTRILCEVHNSVADGWFGINLAATNELSFALRGNVGSVVHETNGSAAGAWEYLAATFDRSLSSNEVVGRVNGYEWGTYNSNNNNAGNFGNRALYLGARGESSLYMTGDIARLFLFDYKLTDAQLEQMRDWAYRYYGLLSYIKASDFEDNAYPETSYGSDSAVYVKHSPGARLVYTTEATELTLTLYNDIYSTFPQFTSVNVRVNGADFADVAPGAAGETVHVIPLDPGTKTVEIIGGLQSAQSPNRAGTYIRSASFNNAATLRAAVSSPRILIYGDSITAGANAAYPAKQGWTQVVRNAYSGSVLSMAQGQRSLHNDASTAALRAGFARHIANSQPNIIWLAIGTNDYSGKKWSSTDFGVAYGDFLDKLHEENPGITIYAQTPIVRNTEGEVQAGYGTLGDYRTAIASAVAGKSFVTLVDGTAIAFPQTGDLDDGVHPTAAGQAKYAAAVKTILGIV